MNEQLFDENLMLDSKDEVEWKFQRLDETEIYKHYAPDIKLSGLQKSPFRNDASPSFSMFDRDGRIMWKDHGDFRKHGSVVDFVMEWFRVKKGVQLNFFEAKRAICNDIALPATATDGEMFFTNDEIGPSIHKKNHKKGETLIQIKDTGWTNWAYGYWIERYQITPPLLHAYEIGHAKEVWVTPPEKETFLWGVSTRENPIFYFYFPETQHIKVYRPLASRKKKWVNNCTNDIKTDIQGFTQLRLDVRRPKLIICTKAMKEVLFWRSFHIDALAIHGENHYYPQDLMDLIKNGSDHQLMFYDNDKSGREYVEQMHALYKIPFMFTKEAKNITDLWEKDPHLVEPYIDKIKTLLL